MAMCILRKLYNGSIRLVTAFLAVGLFYVGAAIMLAAFFYAQMTVLPFAGQWIPQSTDNRVLLAGWLVFSVACLWGFGSIVARGLNVIFNLLDSLSQKLFANEPCPVPDVA